jgi:TRAP transporter 4TM/12TM fusion protein
LGPLIQGVILISNETKHPPSLYYKFTNQVVSIVFIFIWLISYYSAFRGGLEPQLLSISMLCPLSAIVFLTRPFSRKQKKITKLLDFVVGVIFAVILFSIQAYIFYNYSDFIRSGMRGRISQQEMVMSFIFMILVFEATRRVGGMPIVILAVLALLHTVYAPHMPGFLFAAGSSWRSVMLYLFKGDGGFWSAAFNAYTKMIVYFVIFSGLLDATGASDFFIKLAVSLTGRFRGGPAKCSVIACGLMGMIQGAAVSNVVTTGSFTIPLMMKNKYSRNFSAALVAVSATGSMIMPPVMGSAAFLMAAFMGVSYASICFAAIIPAILYYTSIFLMVHFGAARDNIVGVPADECPKTLDVLREGWYFLIPLLIIIIMMAYGFSATLAAVWSTIAIVLLSFVKKSTAITPRKCIAGIIKGLDSSLSIAMFCATAGLISGAVTQSGLALRISGLIIDFASNSLLPALILTAVICLILGMGLTTPIVYITGSTLFVPVLVKLGITPMAAHMFVLYYGVVSNVTPPVALASYASAGIAGSNPIRTANEGFFLGIVAFVMPFAFAFNPELLGIGNPKDIVLCVGSALIGCFALASGVAGWWMLRIQWFFRPILAFAGLLMIWPGVFSDLIGLAIFFAISIYLFLKKKIQIIT